jgi:hypothetical protein
MVDWAPVMGNGKINFKTSAFTERAICYQQRIHNFQIRIHNYLESADRSVSARFEDWAQGRLRVKLLEAKGSHGMKMGNNLTEFSWTRRTFAYISNGEELPFYSRLRSELWG